MNLDKETIHELGEIDNTRFKRLQFYYEDHLEGFKFLNDYCAKDPPDSGMSMYYNGPYIDLTPIFSLDDFTHYYYQDDDEKTIPLIREALDVLKERKIITGLRETKLITPDYSYDGFKFSIVGDKKNHPKHLFISQDDARKNPMPEVSTVDLIYAYRSFLTDEILENAKIRSLILDRPGSDFKDYKIKSDQIEIHNLSLLVHPLSQKKQFSGSKLYRKK